MKEVPREVFTELSAYIRKDKKVKSISYVILGNLWIYKKLEKAENIKSKVSRRKNKN